MATSWIETLNAKRRVIDGLAQVGCSVLEICLRFWIKQGLCSSPCEVNWIISCSSECLLEFCDRSELTRRITIYTPCQSDRLQADVRFTAQSSGLQFALSAVEYNQDFTWQLCANLPICPRMIGVRLIVSPCDQKWYWLPHLLAIIRWIWKRFPNSE